MKKKSMLLVTAAGFLAGLAAACVVEGGAAYGYVGDGDGGYILKNAVVTEEEVVIPSEINGRPVSKIDDHLFFENKKIKNGEIPEEWEKEPHKLSQKDTDARWTKKGDEKHYGYKDHVKVDADSKLILDYAVTPANVHDSNEFENFRKLQ